MRRLAQLITIGVATVASVLLIGWWQVDGPGVDASPGERPLPLIAMDFSLTDQNGNDVGPETLIGQPSLIFFGFTFCPDICPTTLSDISGWLDDLGPEAETLNVIFITVDPERDTVEELAIYLDNFHPQIQGWTGSDEQIAAAASGFRATYERVARDDGDYTMNHTASVFLFRADGRFASTVDYHEAREFAVPKIRRAMKNRAEGAES